MKKISKESSAFVEIRRQKEEALQNIRREKSLMQIYSTALLSPLKHNNKGVPTTPMKSLFNTISNTVNKRKNKFNTSVNDIRDLFHQTLKESGNC